MNNNFYIPQDPGIRNIIQAIWQAERSCYFQKEQILPKGVIEVIFNFSDSRPIKANIGNQEYYLSNCFINGFNTMPIQLQLPEQQVFLGVIFQPMAVKKILKIPASEFSDVAVDLAQLAPAFNTLWYQLAEQIDFTDRVNILLGWFKKINIDWQPREQLMNNFLSASNQPDLSVPVLANALCYSPRHLSRKVEEATGMNTEEILLYKKYLQAVDLIHQEKMSMTAIAHQCQFSDQSHFIRTFKAYTGITPGDYKRNRSLVKGHLFEDVR